MDTSERELERQRQKQLDAISKVNEPDSCPCGLCGKTTRMTATKRCDYCWELETRIHHNPVLAQKILNDFNFTPEKENG